jgi:RHS repeat-associated protein
MTFAGSTGGSPVLAHRYLYGPAGQVLVDEVFETVGGQRVSDEVLWLLADHQGTVRDVVDSDGVLRKHVEYDAFGRITQEEFYAENGSPISAGHAEAVDQLFYYTGQDRDATTDLQLHGARWYDPATARWLSEDPIAFDGGDPNLYRYAGNSAPNFTDPTGLSQAGNPLKSLASVSKPFTNVNYAAPSPQATLSQADQYFANQRSSRSVYDPLYVAPSFTGPKRSTAPLPTDSQILSNYFNDPRYQAIQRAEDDAYTVQTAQYLIQQGSVGQATVAQLVLTGHELYGGFVPGVGEFQDAEAFLGRSSTLTERSVAGASLGLNILTAGAAPNFGGAGRVLRTETHYLDEVLDAQRFTHQIDTLGNRTLVEQPRNALGQFSPKAGGELRPGSIAEQATFDAVRQKPGWQVIDRPVSVRDATGQLRVYDGAAISPNGRVIGLETKSGTGRLTPAQRAFDAGLNSSAANSAQGVGQSSRYEVQRAIEVRR